MLKQTEGSRAVAEAVALCRPEVICAYPITPQTHIVEGLGEMVKKGEIANCEFINVESEFAAWYQDPNSRAKIAAVDRHRELKDHRAPKRLHWWMVSFFFDGPPQHAACQEKDGPPRRLSPGPFEGPRPDRSSTEAADSTKPGAAYRASSPSLTPR